MSQQNKVVIGLGALWLGVWFGATATSTYLWGWAGLWHAVHVSACLFLVAAAVITLGIVLDLARRL
jgi:hypothetical protein